MKLSSAGPLLFLFIFVISFPFSADAGLVTGSTARAEFEKYRWRQLDMFIDFEKVANGRLLQLPYLKLRTTLFRWPRPITASPPGTPVIVLPYDYVTSTPDNNRLMGAVKVSKGYIPDGQSQFEIDFSRCLQRVGLLRMWNTYSTTSFFHYNQKVIEYRNVNNEEFVGYIASSTEDRCITRVEFDGHFTEEEYGGS